MAQQFGITTDPALTSVANIVYLKYSHQPFYHLTSSCRMGKCTDLNGNVNGATGLTVCDNSLLPEIPDANPTKTMLAMCREVVRRVLTSCAGGDNDYNPSNDGNPRNWSN